jgi:hypothetical protein
MGVRAYTAFTVAVCMVATITRNTGLVALLNWGGVTHNTRPVAMHNTVFMHKFQGLWGYNFWNYYIWYV